MSAARSSPSCIRGSRARMVRVALDGLSLLRLLGLALALQVLTGCRPAKTTGWQGWIEGEFVHVASPLAGRVESLAVEKGARVEAGAPLFALERTAELAAQREAAGRLQQAKARLEDLRKGQRPSELAAIEARLAKARSVAALSALELERITRLRAKEVVADGDLDRARLNHEANVRSIAEMESQLATARLGGREDAISAAEAEIAALQAAVERADWSVAQKSVTAPVGGLVHDRLYRPGEFVPAGNPVVSLLPPGNLKVRFFVPEADFSTLKAGDSVQVKITGRPGPLASKVSYLATRPEYTPPVLYNRENRSKLVFLVEAVPVDTAASADLRPGQPVDVSR